MLRVDNHPGPWVVLILIGILLLIILGALAYRVMFADPATITGDVSNLVMQATMTMAAYGMTATPQAGQASLMETQWAYQFALTATTLAHSAKAVATDQARLAQATDIPYQQTVTAQAAQAGIQQGILSATQLSLDSQKYLTNQQAAAAATEIALDLHEKQANSRFEANRRSLELFKTTALVLCLCLLAALLVVLLVKNLLPRVSLDQPIRGTSRTLQAGNSKIKGQFTPLTKSSNGNHQARSVYHAANRIPPR